MISKEELFLKIEKLGILSKENPDIKAILGFGSSGAEIDRLDEYSDIDFLIIPKETKKEILIDNLSWLESELSISYVFRNELDGFKIFFSDGIFAEFGVLYEKEWKSIPHGKGRIIWAEEDIDINLIKSTKEIENINRGINWHLNEILTLLYVGLCRFARGEKLSAYKYIQEQAFDNLIILLGLMSKEVEYYRDPFQNERRYEKRYPHLAPYLGRFLLGYNNSPDSAIKMVQFLDERFQINQFIKNKIIVLALEIKE